MYASVRRYEGISPETAREILKRSHGGFRSRLQQHAGFVAHEVVIGEDSMTAISVFENWVVAEETSRLARDWIEQNMSDLGLPTPQVTAGEVYSEPALPAPFSPPRAPGQDVPSSRRGMRRRAPAG